jgi:hypothetical protein
MTYWFNYILKYCWLVLMFIINIYTPIVWSLLCLDMFNLNLRTIPNSERYIINVNIMWAVCPPYGTFSLALPVLALCLKSISQLYYIFFIAITNLVVISAYYVTTSTALYAALINRCFGMIWLALSYDMNLRLNEY